MQHVFELRDSNAVDDGDKCFVCGASRGEITAGIATVECLGPAGYNLRKEAILSSQATTNPDPGSKLGYAVHHGFKQILEDVIEQSKKYHGTRWDL